MRNQKTANIVELDIASGTWYSTTIAYENVSHNGCLLLWDEKKIRKQHGKYNQKRGWIIHSSVTR